jgi:hypothetical protein
VTASNNYRLVDPTVVGRCVLLGQIRQGLRARWLGRRIVILYEDLDAYLQNAEQVAPSGPDQQK